MLTQLYTSNATTLEALDPPCDIPLSIGIDYNYYIDVLKARIEHQWQIAARLSLVTYNPGDPGSLPVVNQATWMHKTSQFLILYG